MKLAQVAHDAAHQRDIHRLQGKVGPVCRFKL